MKTQSSNTIVQELKKTEGFKNSTEEELLNFTESLRLFSVILYELYQQVNSAKNEQRKSN